MTTTALRSRVGVALIAATVFSSMVAFLDANVVNVAVPAIGRDLGAGVVALQWMLTGYLLTGAALLLLAGALADHFGRERILVIGLLVMLVSSVRARSPLARRAGRGPGGTGRRRRDGGGRRPAPVTSALLPGILLQGLGLRLAVTPLTAAVLAAVDDTDLGEASAVNDAASRIGGAIAIAAVPLLIGAGQRKALSSAGDEARETAWGAAGSARSGPRSRGWSLSPHAIAPCVPACLSSGFSSRPANQPATRTIQPPGHPAASGQNRIPKELHTAIVRINLTIAGNGAEF